MLIVDVDEFYREGIGHLNDATAGKGGNESAEKAMRIFQTILNANPGNSIVLCSIGSVENLRGNYGIASHIFSQIVSREPKNGVAWNNLGLAWRGMNDYGKADACFQKALKYDGGQNLAIGYTNLAAINLNRGRAAKALEYSDLAIKADPKFSKAHWHWGLANLELRNWEAGWEGHEARLYGGAPAEQEIAWRNYHGDKQTPLWEGQSGVTVAVHGEEGVGDEVMFASCIPDLIAHGCKVIVEPHPRLQELFRRSFPDAKVYGTHKTNGEDWVSEIGLPDYKIAIGSLPKFFRKTAGSFPGTPYLKPDMGKVAVIRARLAALGPKPNIGISWQGGVEQTRFHVRSFHPRMFKPIFDAIDANWISLQYDPTAQQCIDAVKDELGVTIHHWPEMVGQKADIDETAAVIASLDHVVTVCQTAVHIAGGLGVQTTVLTPSEPNWRYGNVPSNAMPWYGTVNLIRQEPESYDWAPVIARATEFLREKFSVRAAA